MIAEFRDGTTARGWRAAPWLLVMPIVIVGNLLLGTPMRLTLRGKTLLAYRWPKTTEKQS